MSRALAIALVALMMVPAASAKTSPPDYPDELTPLLDAWIAEAEALGAPSRNATWYAEAAPWLQKAHDARAQGRLRVGMFQLETYTEIVRANQLIEGSVVAGSQGARKTWIVERAQEAAAEAEANWSALRRDLEALESDVRSLQTVEKAMYAGELGLTAMALPSDLKPIATAFNERPEIEVDYVAGLVRASYTALLGVGWARDILEKAGTSEGLPPLLLVGNWTNLTTAILQIPGEQGLPGLAGRFEERVAPARAKNESIVTLVGTLMEQREMRGFEMERIFGDARSRGKDVVGDAAKGMRARLNNTTMDAPLGYGLGGVFTADAIDRATYTDDLIPSGNLSLSHVITAWTALEYQENVRVMLAGVSPVAPKPQVEKPAPLGAGVVLAAGALAALVLTRRR